MRKFFTDRTPPDRNQLANIYDAHAPTWLARESRAETKLTSERWRNDLVRELHGDVLEIGVAAGDNLVRMGGYDHHVTSFTGVDLSPAMIEAAKSAARDLTIPVALHVADAEHLSLFADNSFDTVTASLVFCTVPDVPSAFAEIARVIRPEGKLVLIEHVLSPNPIIGMMQKRVAPIQIRQMGCHLDRTTIETLTASGFRIEQQRRRLFGIMRYVVARPPSIPVRVDSA